ncbi:unnamed protein product [Brassica oleracea]|uniref:(rape) hypothetical protein n=1 Tax=Brassica napus TaxID=3708 RepID=A0A816KFZ3_BRANA|nr:unnamed protein product [Brassica napus]
MAYSVQKEVYSSDKTLSNVVLQNLKFPDSPLGSLQAKDFIRELLVKRRQRTGSSQRKVLQRLNDNNSLKEAQVHLEATIIGILNAKP